ncbi:MAG: dihydroorotase [Deltaproteobacteria bacterium HGW-Deltaproteobacteria-11]|nr:MAG: dihydroorotase [Deltaproteobacteria bacterium HGW-Deltaproteobacteria-11]
MRLLLRGARVVDPSQPIDEKIDILIENGKIVRLGKNIYKAKTQNGEESPSTLKTLDLRGKIVVPGLIDMHTHLREPGFEYKETIQTGCEAAAAGGFTAVACMPNTNPVNDNRSVTESIIRRARECNLCHVYPVAAISRRSEGAALAEFWDLKDAGAVAFSDDGKPVMNAALMRRAMEYACSLDMPVISHCEDLHLSAGGAMNEGFVSTELGLHGIPSMAEEVMAARDILIAEFTGTAIHIAHVSTAGTVRLIREAKVRGIRVTAETAPHYFTLTDEAVREFDVNAKVNPPLRGIEDVAAVREGLRDGTIDVIAGDHAPHAMTDKDVEFDEAAFGMVALETSLGLSLKLVSDGILTLDQLIRKMSTAPARILRIPGGTLKAGAVADVTVIDPAAVWTVDRDRFRSRGRNTPFHGWDMKGKSVMTIVGGKIRHHEP